MDALRVSDYSLVFLKKIITGSDEVKITTYFQNEKVRHDSRNHCIPVWDLFPDDKDPSISYLVMPLLRHLDDPGFETVDDIVDLVTQLLEVCFEARQ